MGSGNWNYNKSYVTDDSYAPMGVHCYALGSATLTKSGLNSAKRYVVSFWAKSGASVLINGSALTPKATGALKNGWQYKEYNLSGFTSVAISGTGVIDELRLYPDDAMMSTYVYSPLLGMTGKCDTKSEITSYVYDNIGRLKLIKNSDGNIVKTSDYHYTTVIPNLAMFPVYSPSGTGAITCGGEGNRLINNICVPGNQVFTSSVIRNGIYVCTYHYEWADGVRSQNYITMGLGDCSTL